MPSLARSPHPSPPGNLLSRDSGGGCGRHQPRSGRLCLEGDDAAATDAVLTAREGAEARDRAQGGGAALHREETAPGQSFEQTKPGTSGASDRGNRDITKRQGARVPGPLQVSHTPQSPAQTPRGQQKILFAFPPSLRNPFSHPKTQTWCWAKTALLYPTSFSPRGQNPVSSFRTRTGHFQESHPPGASLLPVGPKVRTSPGSCTHIPEPASHPRGRGCGRGRDPGRCQECARRGWGSSEHGAGRSLGFRAERSGPHGSRLLPQGRATLRRQRHETK